MNVSTKELKDYLECGSIYKGASPKKKTDLIEMIAYGWMTGTLNKKDMEDISIKQEKQILNKKKHSNKFTNWTWGYDMGLKIKEIKPCVKEKPCINVTE